MSHVPTPWRLAGKATIRAGKDNWICSLHWRDRDANAAFILRACNSYQRMFDALQDAKDFIDPETDPPTFNNRELLRRIEAALKAGAS